MNPLFSTLIHCLICLIIFYCCSPDCAIYIIMAMDFLQSRREIAWDKSDAARYRGQAAARLLVHSNSRLKDTLTSWPSAIKQFVLFIHYLFIAYIYIHCIHYLFFIVYIIHSSLFLHCIHCIQNTCTSIVTYKFHSYSSRTARVGPEHQLSWTVPHNFRWCKACSW